MNDRRRKSCASELVGFGSIALAFSTCVGRTEQVLDQHFVWNGHLISFLVAFSVIGSVAFLSSCVEPSTCSLHCNSEAHVKLH